MTTLCKFINDPQIASSLLDGNVKFTPINELNDPAELNPTLNREAVADSLNRMRANGYSEDDMLNLQRQGELFRIFIPLFDILPRPKTPQEASNLIFNKFYDSIEIFDAMLSEVAKIIASQVGIFCLSKRFQSLPMWAHYAKNATGFAIEFNNLEDTFTGDLTGVLKQPREVVYEPEIEGVTFDPKSHESLFFSKFSDWRYEEEVRIVMPLSECIRDTNNSKPLYLAKIPKNCIRRIILGWNMTEASEQLIRLAISEKNPEVQVDRASFRNGKICLSD